MMKLEEYINRNRQAFDSEEPEPGHFSRFEQRLQNGSSRKKRRIHWYAWASAAVIVLILGSTFFIAGRYNQPEKCVLSGEMKEIRNYYDAKMNREINRINSLLADANPAVRTEVMNDILKLKMDSEIYPGDICRGMNNEKEIAVMVERYRIKIKTLQSMASFFEKNHKININKAKLSTHENII